MGPRGSKEIHHYHEDKESKELARRATEQVQAAMQSLEEQRQVYRNLEAQQQRSEQEFQETLRREADRHEKQRAEDQAAWDRRLREEQELRTAEAEANLRRLEECQQDALRRVEEAHEQERKKIHQERLERWRRLRREYPVPEFLQHYVNEVSEDAMADANNEPFVNVALVGDAGRGKSSLIRAILQHFQIELPEDQMPVVSAEGDGTTEPTRYPLTNLGRNVSLWDLPGQGTRRIPSLTYLRDMGLKYLDLAVLVTCERVTEGDLGVLVAIKYAQDVRCLVARTKVDLAVDDEQHDHGLSQVEALNEVRRKVQLQTEIRPERIHLVTSRPRFWNEFGAVAPFCEQLRQEVMASLQRAAVENFEVGAGSDVDMAEAMEFEVVANEP